mmetsp:Transcript_7865/g.11879  ORF Transcript_7865/g.11879 Transcript_7865/m.11879 type:complete len:323 (-) Transcript_7865:124-1092(-)
MGLSYPPPPDKSHYPGPGSYDYDHFKMGYQAPKFSMGFRIYNRDISFGLPGPGAYELFSSLGDPQGPVRRPVEKETNPKRIAMENNAVIWPDDWSELENERKAQSKKTRDKKQAEIDKERQDALDANASFWEEKEATDLKKRQKHTIDQIQTEREQKRAAAAQKAALHEKWRREKEEEERAMEAKKQAMHKLLMQEVEDRKKAAAIGKAEMEQKKAERLAEIRAKEARIKQERIAMKEMEAEKAKARAISVNSKRAAKQAALTNQAGQTKKPSQPPKAKPAAGKFNNPRAAKLQGASRKAPPSKSAKAKQKNDGSEDYEDDF